MDRNKIPLLLAAIAIFCMTASPVLAISADPVVARPVPASVTPSAIYGQGDAKLPSSGITVTEKKSTQQAFDDELDAYADAVPTQSIADPLEPWNRFWFGFNDIFYLYIAQPAYKAWVWAIPSPIRTGLNNFWQNLLFPLNFVNYLLQGRFRAAGVSFGRFIINTTTSLGFADVAATKKTVVPIQIGEEETLDQTLGSWGIGHGFYLVWPFIGPSSARDTVGRVGNYFSYPSYWASYVIEPWYVPSAIQLGFFFNELDAPLDAYVSLKNAAVDPYIAMREAWVAFRARQVAR